MTIYHDFDENAIDEALAAAKSHHDYSIAKFNNETNILADSGHIMIGAQCISVSVEDNKVCLNLPLGIGKICLPIPISIPNGTAAKACLHICTTWGIPTGVKVKVSVAGVTIITKSFGKC